MLPRRENLSKTTRDFAWEIPERYNIGRDVCDRWAEVDPDRLAILEVAESGGSRQVSFGELRRDSNRLAGALASLGLAGGAGGRVGDRVGVLLPQRAETAMAHIAAFKMGCVSIPLFTLFGEEALLHRLRDSGARAVVTDAPGAARIAALRDRLPALEVVLSVDGEDANAAGLRDACKGQPETYPVADTLADDPALLIYTSGTTGAPKGALHAHRVLLGHLPGVEISHDVLPQEGDRIWTPADWAWIGGLLDVLMPALHHGIPVVARRFGKFDAAAAFALMRDHGVRNAFLPPTALKLMKRLPGGHVRLRSAASGGETLGPELLRWGQGALGTTINEFYGQTECNMVISSCAALEEPKPGWMGRAVPGHRVEIVDPATGAVLPTGTEGAIAVLSPDPVMFLGYWNDPEATAAKFVDGPGGRWMLTGDRGVKDAEGRFRFVGRDDDVIGSAGYRIGPAEVEDCLLGHEAVELAGVVGKPDPVRGSVVAAYVKLRPGWEPSDALADGIASHVKARLAAHEYPRAVRFVAEMPMTTTGKIVRAELRRMAEEEAAREAEERLVPQSRTD